MNEISPKVKTLPLTEMEYAGETEGSFVALDGRKKEGPLTVSLFWGLSPCVYIVSRS